MSSVIYLGAGCFWGVQEKLKLVPGVLETEVGYSGGKTQDPTYEEVCRGGTGHAEVCKVTFEAQHLDQLLDVFFEIHDPTQLNRQGMDIGDQYRSAIFVTNPEQKKKAKEWIEKLNSRHDNQVVTQLEDFSTYTKAEDYHQDYVQKKDRSCAF
jgi:methionine-S-sulfoxide reductase